MYTKDDVAHLVSELSDQKLDPAVEVGEPTHFGLALDVFDPVSHEIITVARPHRRDTGQSEILLSSKQTVQVVLSARAYRLASARAAGHLTIEAANEAAKRDADTKALAAKQAADAAPKPQGEKPSADRRNGDPNMREPARAR